ncbi:MAG: cytosine permease, partial [Saprospiraceae bacterium]
RKGGYITGLIGMMIFPWKLIADPSGYIFTWLVGYSSLLGPVGGIMIVDYYFIRNQTLILDDLYDSKGRYSFTKGFNPHAIAALIIGILPNIPGFLMTIGMINKDLFPQWVTGLYHYAWFVGFGLSGWIYWLLMKNKK